MTLVEFHQLDAADRSERDRYGCLLAYRCYQHGHRVHIRVHDAAHAEVLDQLLWSFRDNSFLPHASSDSAEDTPVTIGHGTLPSRGEEVMVNLDDRVPEDFASFRQIYEIVIDEPEARQASRHHYRFYREHGLGLQHQSVPATAR